MVSLAVILAAAGSARADGKNSTSDQTSSAAPSTSGSSHSSGTAPSTSGNVHSSGIGAVQQGTVVRPSGITVAPVARHFPANVPNPVQGNVSPPVHRQFLTRSEILARQATYLNRNQLNPAVAPGMQGTLGTGQFRSGQTDFPNQSVLRTRRHHDDEDNAQNGTNPTNRTGDKRVTNGAQGANGKPIPATNAGLHSGKPVLSFNNANTMSFADACRRHHDRHDRDWWRNHCHTIILIGNGFYAWDLGYWYPAYGYDPNYSNYAYNGPIYGYDGLAPDQVIANVQYALQQLGYFSEAVDGMLGPATQAAIEDYQVENNLPVTGAIDRPTLVALGFIY